MNTTTATAIETHTHTCRGCYTGVDCTGNGEGCFDGYCDGCPPPCEDCFSGLSAVSCSCDEGR